MRLSLSIKTGNEQDVLLNQKKSENKSSNPIVGIGLVLLFACVLPSCSDQRPFTGPMLEPGETPSTKLGERLFRETRFSQAFAAQKLSSVNSEMVRAEPALMELRGVRGNARSPFSNQTMSCVACHMVDDAARIPGAGMRTYADFGDRTFVPERDRAGVLTPRNSPALVGAVIPSEQNQVFHYDGEFATLEDLVIGGFTSRNFGWLPKEQKAARNMITRVIREDDGHSLLARQFGGSYATILLGEDSNIPDAFRIPQEYRLNVARATEAEILNRVGFFVAEYVRSLQFAQDSEGNYIGSPYDVFLLKNGLPRQPESGESSIAYAGRLSWAIAQLNHPKFVGGEDGEFGTHFQSFEFGPKELQGLQIFLSRRPEPSRDSAGFPQVGNCVACHAPPTFTDLRFHNTGATQEEYDSVHGSGSFLGLKIPNWAERNLSPEKFLPASSRYPKGTGQFQAAADRSKAERTDLGLWNILGNPSYPKPQPILMSMVCPGKALCSQGEALESSVALFKTPSLRDLGHSDPYLHTGRMRSIEEVLRFYQSSATLSRMNLMRNADPEIAKINLDQPEDIDALAAFLRALNEDYE